jgi:hypothetical protein
MTGKNRHLHPVDDGTGAETGVPTADALASFLRHLAARRGRHFLEVLDGTAWPKVVAKNAADLATCIAGDVSWFDTNTRITRRSDMTPASRCGSSDAQLIRVRLRIPSETS